VNRLAHFDTPNKKRNIMLLMTQAPMNQKFIVNLEKDLTNSTQYLEGDSYKQH